MFKLFSTIVGVSKEQIVQCPSCKGNIIQDATLCIHCGSPVKEHRNTSDARSASDGSSQIEI
jgi:hypothetical protein